VDVRLSVAIQAHPDRALMARTLASEVGGDVVYDPDPHGALRSPWRTYRECLLSAPQGASHLLILQDDVEVCPGFRDAAEAAVRARSDRLIVFFVAGNPATSRIAVERACQADLPWAELPHAQWIPVVAACWPVWMIAPMLEFIDSQRWNDTFYADDERCGRWASYAGVVPLATVPSLVEHPNRVPSIIGKRSMGPDDPGRVAVCYIGAGPGCGLASDIDWTLG